MCPKTWGVTCSQRASSNAAADLGIRGERLSMHQGTQTLHVPSELCFLFIGGFQFLPSEPARFERLIFLPVAFSVLLFG